MKITKTLALIIGRFTNWLSVIFIKSFSLISSLTLVALIILFIGLYFGDKYLTGGYYSGYLMQIYLIGELDWGWEFSSFLAARPFLGMVLICGFFAVMIFLKFVLRRILTMRERKHNLFTNLVYLAVNVSLSIIILSATLVLVFNAMITGYINAAIGQNDMDNADFFEKWDFLEQQVKENQSLSSATLHKIMFDIENNAEYIDNADRLALCTEVNYLINLQGGPLNKAEHYLRNSLNAAPLTLDEMLDLIRGADYRLWNLMPPEDAVFHMFGLDGEYNLKFVSANGFFEAVYNKDGELLTVENGPVNMGTYNFASPLAEPQKHSTYDILPYLQWGNTPDIGPPQGSENVVSNLDKFQNNSAAVERYNNLLETYFAP